MNTQKWHGHATAVRVAASIGCAALVLSVTGTAAQAKPGDPARQTLAANDGWAAYGTGTTGGAAADAAHVHTVTTWAGFKAALAADGSAPKIIKVKGTIDAVSEGCDSSPRPATTSTTTSRRTPRRAGAWTPT